MAPRPSALRMPGWVWPWPAPPGHATMPVIAACYERERGDDIMKWMLLLGLILGMVQTNTVGAVDDKSPLIEKAAYLQQVLLDKHWPDGLYVGIIDSPSPRAKLPLPHTVNQPGNMIHAGVWTGRYLGGV